MSSTTNTTYTDADNFITCGTLEVSPEETPTEGCSICHMPFASTKSPSKSEGKCPYPVKIIGCQHVFGIQCLQEWTDVGTTCPLCRKVLFVEEELAPQPSLVDLIMRGELDSEGAREFLMVSLGHAMGMLGVCEEQEGGDSGSETEEEGGEVEIENN